MAKKRSRLKKLLWPHSGNQYKPTLLAWESVAALLLLFGLIESVYFLHVQVLFKQPAFTAAVLPAALTVLTNTDRQTQNLPELIRDPLLDQVAQAKADDMAASGYFAHVSPSGKTPWDWLKQFDYPYGYAGENLAINFDESVDVESAWMNSPAHRDNILKSEYKYIGFGIAHGVYQGKETTFVAEYFATKRSSISETSPAPITAEQRNAVAATPPTRVAETGHSEVLGTAVVPGNDTDGPQSVTENRLSSLSVYAITNPRLVNLLLVSAILLLVVAVVLVSLFFHVRKRYLHLEFLFAAAILILSGVFIIFFNQGMSSRVIISQNTEASTVGAPLM